MSAKKKPKSQPKKPKAAKRAAPKKEKRAKPKPEKAAAAPAPVAVAPPVVQARPVPGAIVSSRHLGGMHTRAARGYSYGELSTAGLSIGLAKRMDLPVDLRRRSVLDGNVAALKGLRRPEAKRRAEPKPEPEPPKPSKKAKGRSKKGPG